MVLREKCVKKAKKQAFSRLYVISDPLQNRGSRVRILLPLPKTKKSMQRIGFFVFRCGSVVRICQPRSGGRVQRLAFLLRKMRSLTARQTCYGAKRSMESFCPCQEKSLTHKRWAFFNEINPFRDL